MTVIVLLTVLACASAAPYFNHQQNQHAYYLYQRNNQQLYQRQHYNQQYYQHHHNQQAYHHHYSQKGYKQYHHNDQQYQHQHRHQPQYPEFNSHDDGNSGKPTDNDFTQLQKTYKDLKKETGRPVKFPYEGKIENNMYKIVIFLPGFEQNEISVKVKPGLLVVQADHEAECEQVTSYVDFKILPEFVDVNGAWAYDKCWLTIVLPLIHKSEEKPATTEVSVTTQHPDNNTEATTTERDQNTTDEEDSDEGDSDADDSDEEIRGDQGEHNIVTPKEVSPGEQPVETTTYAIPPAVEY